MIVARCFERCDLVVGEVGRESVDAGQVANVALVVRNARIEIRRKRFDGEPAGLLHHHDDGLRRRRRSERGERNYEEKDAQSCTFHPTMNLACYLDLSRKKETPPEVIPCNPIVSPRYGCALFATLRHHDRLENKPD